MWLPRAWHSVPHTLVTTVQGYLSWAARHKWVYVVPLQDQLGDQAHFARLAVFEDRVYLALTNPGRVCVYRISDGSKVCQWRSKSIRNPISIAVYDSPRGPELAVINRAFSVVVFRLSGGIGGYCVRKFRHALTCAEWGTVHRDTLFIACSAVVPCLAMLSVVDGTLLKTRNLAVDPIETAMHGPSQTLCTVDWSTQLVCVGPADREVWHNTFQVSSEPGLIRDIALVSSDELLMINYGTHDIVGLRASDGVVTARIPHAQPHHMVRMVTDGKVLVGLKYDRHADGLVVVCGKPP